MFENFYAERALVVSAGHSEELRSPISSVHWGLSRGGSLAGWELGNEDKSSGCVHCRQLSVLDGGATVPLVAISFPCYELLPLLRGREGKGESTEGMGHTSRIRPPKRVGRRICHF